MNLEILERETFDQTEAFNKHIKPKLLELQDLCEEYELNALFAVHYARVDTGKNYEDAVARLKQIDCRNVPKQLVQAVGAFDREEAEEMAEVCQKVSVVRGLRKQFSGEQRDPAEGVANGDLDPATSRPQDEWVQEILDAEGGKEQ